MSCIKLRFDQVIRAGSFDCYSAGISSAGDLSPYVLLNSFSTQEIVSTDKERASSSLSKS